jgi:O-antigen/teichoic acid export membrane protein
MFLHVLKRSFLAFAAMGFLASLFLFLASPFIIRLLFSSTFDESSGALRVLSIMLTFYFINSLVFQSLIAIHKEIHFTAIMIFSALLSIGGNLFLIPKYGYFGAAWMRVFVEGASCLSAILILLWHIKKRTKESWPDLVTDELTIR